MDGARWVQQHILATNPRAPLRVYAIWFDAFEGDERGLVDASLLADGRVTHFWDEEKRAGKWYTKTLTRPHDPKWVEWDAFFVYAPGDTWEQAGARPVRWGRTVIGRRDDLRAAVASLLE